jgi:hypothetical protein
MKKNLIVPILCVFLMLLTAAALEAQPKMKVVTITFAANVQGAKVYLNDKYMGDSPYVNKFPVGTYTLRVEADGYEDYVKSVQLVFDTTLNIELRRAIRDFNINIEADARGAKVYLDDRMVGNTPFRGRIRMGQHSVKIIAAGYDDYIKTIDVNGDIDLRADMRRQVRDYNVNILVNVGGSKIYIDDRLVGTAQYRGRIQEGQHSVRVNLDGYEEYSKTIDVNGDVRLSVDLQKIRRMFMLSIQANAEQAKVSINGQEQNGFAPMDLKLDQGRYTVKVTRRGYLAFETTVDLNRDTRIDAKLGAPKARIVIQAPERRGPGGLRLEISLDGRKVQGTEFDVERGRHVIRVEAGGMVTEQTVDVREGRTYTFKLVLDLQSPQDSERDFGR